MTDTSTMRVIPAGSFLDDPAPLERSGPQAHIDTALENALRLAVQAAEDAAEAVAWLETVAPSKNRNVPTFIGQLIAEIRETIRVKQ